MNATHAIMPFDFGEHSVRTIVRDGDPWFVVKDVCDILGLKNPTMAIEDLEEDERNTLSISEGIQAGPGNPNLNLINESGLYSLIFRSRKPEARAFRKWVTGVVLPEIRRTGGFGGRPSLPDAASLKALSALHRQGVLSAGQLQALIGAPAPGECPEPEPRRGAGFRVPPETRAEQCRAILRQEEEAVRFLAERCVTGPRLFYPTVAVYKAYLQFAGPENAMTRARFSRFVGEQFPGLEGGPEVVIINKRFLGETFKCFIGLALREEEDAAGDPRALPPEEMPAVGWHEELEFRAILANMPRETEGGAA